MYAQNNLERKKMCVRKYVGKKKNVVTKTKLGTNILVTKTNWVLKKLGTKKNLVTKKCEYQFFCYRKDGVPVSIPE